MTALAITDAQLRQLMRDEQFRAELVQEQARLIHQEIVTELGDHIGRKFTIPVSMAVRLSGFNEKWIRRNLPIVTAEGQNDAIQFGDLTDAIEQRKTKGANNAN